MSDVVVAAPVKKTRAKKVVGEAAPVKKVVTKKEKKPIQVVAIVTPDGIEGTFSPEPRRPLIVHLPFRSKDVTFSETEMRYDPNPPPQPEPFGRVIAQFVCPDR